MHVFSAQQFSGSPAEAVALLAEPGTCPPPSAIQLVGVPGPGMRGVVTRWWLWRIRKGVESLTVPSVLNEGDPEDAPFPCREGLVAIPSGSLSAYVGALRSEDEGQHRRLAEEMLRWANSDMGCPVSDPESPIPAEHLSLAESLDGALEEAFSGAASRPRALSDLPWVEVTDQQGFQVMVQILEGGELLLELITEVYVDGLQPEEAQGVAEELRDEEIAPLLLRLGFVLDEEAAASTEEDLHDGGVVSGWSRLVPDVETAAQIIEGLQELSSPHHVRFELTESD